MCCGMLINRQPGGEETVEGLWYQERTKNVVISHKVRNHIVSTRSRIQQIDVVDTYEYGRMLFLDNMAQSSEVDEFIYHEMMVHPALFSHPPVRSVCIIGGSEGATLREVLRHNPERVVMIDIDEELVEICKKHLPEWSAGAYDDPRVDLKFMDGRKFMAEADETFDAVLIDLSDPLENAPSTMLFTQQFYNIVKNSLTPQGCVIVQSESLNPNRIEPHARVYNTLKSTFPFVQSYSYLSHSFHEIYSFVIASLAVDPAEKDVEAAVKASGLDFRCYSAELHRGLFCIPAYMRDAYARFPKLITDEDVVYYPNK